MNHAAILALIADLYAQVAALQAENAQLREQAPQPDDEQGGSLPGYGR